MFVCPVYMIKWDVVLFGPWKEICEFFFMGIYEIQAKKEGGISLISGSYI